jgi:hypothetical protein
LGRFCWISSVVLGYVAVLPLVIAAAGASPATRWVSPALAHHSPFPDPRPGDPRPRASRRRKTYELPRSRRTLTDPRRQLLLGHRLLLAVSPASETSARRPRVRGVSPFSRSSNSPSGLGAFDGGVETLSIRIALTTGIPEERCQRVDLGHAGHRAIDRRGWAGRDQMTNESNPEQ